MRVSWAVFIALLLVGCTAQPSTPYERALQDENAKLHSQITELQNKVDELQENTEEQATTPISMHDPVQITVTQDNDQVMFVATANKSAFIPENSNPWSVYWLLPDGWQKVNLDDSVCPTFLWNGTACVQTGNSCPASTAVVIPRAAVPVENETFVWRDRKLFTQKDGLYVYGSQPLIVPCTEVHTKNVYGTFLVEFTYSTTSWSEDEYLSERRSDVQRVRQEFYLPPQE